MDHSQTVPPHARDILAAAEAKIERLRNIEPYLLDLSLRENTVGSRLGQTLQDKLAILPKLREFGFRHIDLGTLDYELPDELETGDDFMAALRDGQVDVSGCFAATAMGLAGADGVFVPDPSQLKLRAYRIPNTLHEISLSREGMAGQYDLDTLRRSLPASIAWLHGNIRGDEGGPPKIIVNIADGCDAFADNLEAVCSILSLLAEQPIEGVSIEDDRGTYLPLQVGAFVAVARSLLPPRLKLLVHVHAGAGYENASVIEALLNGADGVWGGLPKRAATIGHASLGELIANLLRLGNRSVEHYRLDQLLPLATWLQELDDGEAVPDDYPVLGRNAYRLTYSAFRQHAGRAMDLPPERIGGRYRYRICPAISDHEVIAGRLAEVLGREPGEFGAALVESMMRLMRRDLRAGRRIDYDQPDALVDLYTRASAAPATQASHAAPGGREPLETP